MISKVFSSYAPQISLSVAKHPSKITRIALIALGLFVTILVVVIVRALKGRAQPRGSFRPQGLTRAPSSEIRRSSTPPPLNLEPRSNENSAPKYPKSLIQACGGQKAFDNIPVLAKDKVVLLYNYKKGVNPYLSIDPKEMTHHTMKGEDPLNRPFLVLRYQDIRAENTQEKEKAPEEKKELGEVHIIFCRDPDANRWYENLEGGHTDFSQTGRGSLLDFIEKLQKGVHSRYKLV